MKNNVIKFDYLTKQLDYSNIDLEKMNFDAWIGNKVFSLQNICSAQYEAHRNNKQIFLGFRKISVPVKSSFSLYADETLEPDPIRLR
jgi:hypothetical protein